MSDGMDQRFAPPQAQVADLVPEQAVLAGRGTRFLAVVVDGIIGAALVWAAMQIPVIGQLLKVQDPDAAADMWAWRPASSLLGLAIFLLVQGWPLVTRGQTVGKILFKLRIVRTDGSKPDAWRLLGLRYGIGVLTNLNVGLAMIYSLVDSLLIFRSSRQCLHDTIADTRVIKL